MGLIGLPVITTLDYIFRNHVQLHPMILKRVNAIPENCLQDSF